MTARVVARTPTIKRGRESRRCSCGHATTNATAAVNSNKVWAESSSWAAGYQDRDVGTRMPACRG